MTNENATKLGLVPIDVPTNSVLNSLPVGTVLHWGGNMAWSAEDYAVIRRYPPSEPLDAMGARYDLLGLEQGASHMIHAFSVKRKGESWHSQHFFLTDLVLSDDEVLSLIEKGKAKIAADEAAKVAEAKRKADERARILAKYKHLEAVAAGGYPSAKLAAANIRRELKRAFPGVKFSVRSDVYSGGDAVNVSWADGPTAEAVERISNKYAEGSFDGMTDSYNRDDAAVWPDVFGGAKYVQTSREVSAHYVHEAAALVLGRFAFKFRAGPEWPVGAEGVDLRAEFAEPTGGSFWNIGGVGRTLALGADLTRGIARLDDDGGDYSRGFFDYRLVGRAEVAAVDAARTAEKTAGH